MSKFTKALRAILGGYRAKETPMSFDLSTLESRFWHDLDEVDSDAEAALHSKIVDTAVTAAKAILPLVPDGSEVENLLGHLDEFAAEAHRLVSGAESVVETKPPEQAPEPADVEASGDPTDQPGPPARPI